MFREGLRLSARSQRRWATRPCFFRISSGALAVAIVVRPKAQRPRRVRHGLTCPLASAPGGSDGRRNHAHEVHRSDGAGRQSATGASRAASSAPGGTPSCFAARRLSGVLGPDGPLRAVAGGPRVHCNPSMRVRPRKGKVRKGIAHYVTRVLLRHRCQQVLLHIGEQAHPRPPLLGVSAAVPQSRLGSTPIFPGVTLLGTPCQGVPRMSTRGSTVSPRLET